jgi:hypothetical protein
MTRADSVHSTPRRFTPKIVAGRDVDLSSTPPAAAKSAVDCSPLDPGMEYVSVRKRPPAEPMTETAKNGQLRSKRREAWRAASAAREYWHARWRLQHAIAIAQIQKIPEGHNHPAINWADPEYPESLKNYRAAITKQLLTPAPDLGAVTWKKAALKAGEHKYTDVKTERIERAIADDLAFLAAHPVRQTRRARSEP